MKQIFIPISDGSGRTMKFRKIVKRILIWLVVTTFLFISSGVIITIVYKDKIIGYFLNETNKYIATPVDVKKIEVSFLNHFPSISVNLYDVTIQESSNDHKGILGSVKMISASFNPIDLLKKNYTIRGIHLSDGKVNLKINQDGTPNYLLIKKDSSKRNSSFSLKNITCEQIMIDYIDQKSDYHIALLAKAATADLVQKDTILEISVIGNIVSDEIKVGKRKFLNNKLVDLDSDFEVDLRNRLYTFGKSELTIDKGRFEISGEVDVSNKTLDLKINGLNTTFQSLNSVLSTDLSKYFKDYRSKGKVYFAGGVAGNYGLGKLPQVKLEFGAKKASFFHPAYKKQITDVSLTGSFTSGNTNHRKNYRLELREFFCKLEEEQLEGSLVLQNFDDYRMDLILRGAADVNTLLLLFPKDYVKTAFGKIDMDIHINGQLKNPTIGRNIQGNGEINLKNVSFVMTGKKLPFNKINGSLIMRNNDLAVSNLSGYVGNSDFRLNGFVIDIPNLILRKNQKYVMQADLQSKHIDFDELLKSNFASRDTTATKNSTYEFRISPKIDLDFNCEIQHLKFKRFHGRKIIGNLEIKNQIAVMKNVSFSSMGGKINISGSVNSKQENLIETISESNFQHINIDSVFYVFKNFNQDWLIDKNLKGQLDADINLYMYFTKNLMLNSKSMIADINTSIINGELNDFEPMMELSKFVEEESLAQMRFSRMTNEIKIENRTIYLPEMEIRSNVSNILISGTHTFDNYIDYHLSVPLKSFIRISKRTDYEQSARRGMNLLLKLQGHTTDYAISYDTKALKENFKKDILDEREEWRNLKKRDTVNQEVPELEDEYFDFEETDTDSTKTKTH